MASEKNLRQHHSPTHIMCECGECGHKWIIKATFEETEKLKIGGCPSCNTMMMVAEKKPSIHLTPITSLQASVLQSVWDGISKIVWLHPEKCDIL